MLRPLIAYPLAIASGALLSAAFEPIAVGLLAPVAVAGLVASIVGSRPRRAFALAFLGGLAFFALLMPWLSVVGTDAWLLLSAFCALWFGLMGIGICLVTRLPGWPWWVAGVWVLQEALRGRIPFGGYPWGRLAYGQPDTVVGRLAWLVGQPGVSMAVVLMGGSLVAMALAIRSGAWRRAALWATLVVLVLGGSSLIRLPDAGDSVGGAPGAVIAAVQGGTPQTGLGAMDVRRAVLTNHVTQTMALATEVDAGARPQPAFVLWPENASDIDPFTDTAAAAAITGAARSVNAPILVGAVVDVPGNPEGVWNLGVVWDPRSGPGERYVKTHPVPFGEYIPLRGLIAPLIGRFDRIPRDFVPGTTPGNLHIGGIAVGNVICFEVAYDDVIDPVVAGGARVITVQTNNATYQGTAQPAQQLAIERMRAIQTGRSVLVAATSGISASIRPDGTVTGRLDEGAVGSIDGLVSLRGGHSPSTSLGLSLEWVVVLLGLGPILWVTVRDWRSRRRRPGPSVAHKVGS
ncbi:MAG: apolipoprotein N-acyltransferase [Actinomycetales bacterium]|nr:apolipoprotein N-acyltransferase [Actinomycetales bacterium]